MAEVGSRPICDTRIASQFNVYKWSYCITLSFTCILQVILLSYFFTHFWCILYFCVCMFVWLWPRLGWLWSSHLVTSPQILAALTKLWSLLNLPVSEDKLRFCLGHQVLWWWLSALACPALVVGYVDPQGVWRACLWGRFRRLFSPLWWICLSLVWCWFPTVSKVWLKTDVCALRDYHFTSHLVTTTRFCHLDKISACLHLQVSSTNFTIFQNFCTKTKK